MDFGALPPEVNSGLMYAGPGSAPMLAAAAAWDGLAAELRSAATGYGSVISDLAYAGWQGPSSAAMAAASAPYVAWMHDLAARAEQAGMQATAAAAAHEAAFAATVHPAVIAANRTLLTKLVATNVMLQNTPAIAATEAQYAEMWAQDAAAMYTYAGSSAAATMLTALAPAPPTTNSAGLASSAIAAAQAALHEAQSAAQGLAAQAGMFFSPVTGLLNQSASSLTSGFQSGLTNIAGVLHVPLGNSTGAGTSALSGTSAPTAPAPVRAPGAVPRPSAPAPAPAPRMQPTAPAEPAMRPAGIPASAQPAATASATMGKATSVGSLSVPSNWAATEPQTSAPAAVPLSSASPAAAAGTRGIATAPLRVEQTHEIPAAAMARPSVLPRLVG